MALHDPLPFKIPITSFAMVSKYPRVFEVGNAEYGSCVDTWLEHKLLSYTSEQAVVALDTMWQIVLKKMCFADILLDEHDVSSRARLRPDFTVMRNGMLVMKGEAKASLHDMNSASAELVSKFHDTAYKLFPDDCNSIPGVLSCNEAVSIHSISYDCFTGQFVEKEINSYDVTDLGGRVNFIVDVFKISCWICSQIARTEIFHLVPDVRTKTSNGHHITLNKDGILKEFHHDCLRGIPLGIIKHIYESKLPNVEQGVTNCKTITITRVGSMLRNAIKAQKLNKTDVFEQIQNGVLQLHSIGYAHCDICVDNCFVDREGVFLGDLEYCRPKDDAPPLGINREDLRAATAAELDAYQLGLLQDELAAV